MRRLDQHNEHLVEQILKDKKNIVLGLWSMVAILLTPLFLYAIYFFASGQDSSQHAGDELENIIFCAELTIVWILLAVIPCMFFIQRIKRIKDESKNM